MTYLIILLIITLIIFYLIKLGILYFLIKFFKKEANLFLILKAILLYELIAFIFLFIDPIKSIYSARLVVGPIVLFPIYLSVVLIFLFLVFKFIMEKFSLLDFKKCLIIFLLMFIIITPILGYLKAIISENLAKKLSLDVALERVSNGFFMRNQYMHFGPLPPDIALVKLISEIDGALFESNIVLKTFKFIIEIQLR